MLGLLAEYVLDARSESQPGSARAGFLRDLARDVTALADRMPDLSAETLVDELRAIHESLSDEFAADPVVEHVAACIEELERIGMHAPEGR